MEQTKSLKDTSQQCIRTHVEFGLEEERTNSRVVSTNTPGLNMVVMAHSNITKKPTHQGKVEVTMVVKQKKDNKEKEQQRSLR